MTAGQGPGPYGTPAGRGDAPEQSDPQGVGAPRRSQPPYGQPPQGQPPHGVALVNQPPQAQSPYGQPPQGQPPTVSPRTASRPTASRPIRVRPGAVGAGRLRGPQSVERPVTVRAGIGAFVGSIVLSVVAHVLTLLNWDEVMAEALTSAEADLGVCRSRRRNSLPTRRDVRGDRIRRGSAGRDGRLRALRLVRVEEGHNWARIVLWVLAGLRILSASSVPGPARHWGS